LQHELFKPRELQVQPTDGLREPRLWFRRFVIWPEPGAAPLQDRTFGPGLNIIWSPDPADHGTHDEGNPPSGPGHAAGKTLTCHLLRYCLGEPQFAADDLRGKIKSAFKDGRVGAEIMVDGKPWAVVRSIGARGHDVVLEGGSLEAAVSPETAPTGMAPFVDLLAERFVTPSVAGRIGESLQNAWLLALAWITRDQDCHFGKITDWRVPGGKSGSPAQGLSAGDATDVVRALIGAITPREHELDTKLQMLGNRRRAEDHAVERASWLIERARGKLLRELDVEGQAAPDGELLGPFLRSVATRRAAKFAVVGARGELASVAGLEGFADEAQKEVERLTYEVTSTEGKVNILAANARLIENQFPGISASLDDGESPVCNVCEVPIDRALADGCKLSNKLPDLQSLRQRRDRLLEDLGASRTEQKAAEQALDRLLPELDAAKTKRNTARSDLNAARKLHNDRAEVWYAARRVSDDVKDLEELLREKEVVRAKAVLLAGEIAGLKEDIAAEREQHAQVISQLSNHFDPLVRRLWGSTATGQVKHDGHGLQPIVNVGTECDSPALDVVKVIAFDLATLCRSIEGATNLPALLIHDSPRTSDLGLSIYHELFHLVRELEGVGSGPQFQYIVTTTSRPPDELVNDQRVRMKLQGAPPEVRLLGRDL
jgi:hypothetical protein